MNESNLKLKINMLLNAIKGVMGIVFPLITFPYVSRVLGTENLGRFSFSSAIVNYFSLLAGLGIATYAIREGSKVRQDEKKVKEFCSQMITIELIVTPISYLLLLIALSSSSTLKNYRALILILSWQIAFKAVDVEWIYSIYEDYFFVTARSIVIQIISMALLFIFVHEEKDIYAYAIINVLSSTGSIIFNYFYSRKYCKIYPTKKNQWRRHIKPILTLFAISVATTIFVNSDTVLLGFLSTDYHIGLYSVSTKIYTVVKTVLSSILVAAIPRLSAVFYDKSKFNLVASDVYKTLLTFIVPAIIGLIILNKPIVLLLSNSTYLKATSSLTLLAIALFFSLFSWFWGHCILVPCGKENIVFLSTLVAAVTNVVLNFIMIPYWHENAAAFTTIIAEGISYLWAKVYASRYVTISDEMNVLIKILVGSMSIIVIASLFKPLESHLILYVILVVICSCLFYFFVEIMLKNDAVSSIWSGIISKLKKFRERL